MKQKGIFFYYVIFCLYILKFLAFHFILMHLKQQPLNFIKPSLKIASISCLQRLAFATISIQVRGNIFMPDVTIKKSLYMSGALVTYWRKLTIELRKKRKKAIHYIFFLFLPQSMRLLAVMCYKYYSKKKKKNY